MCVCWVGYRCVFILFVTVLYFTVCLCFLRFYNSMMEQFNLIHIIHNWSFWKAYYHWLTDHWYMTNDKIDLEEDETVYVCSMCSVEVQWGGVFNLRGILEEPSFYNSFITLQCLIYFPCLPFSLSKPSSITRVHPWMLCKPVFILIGISDGVERENECEATHHSGRGWQSQLERIIQNLMISFNLIYLSSKTRRVS